MKLVDRLNRVANLALTVSAAVVLTAAFYALFLEKSYLSYPKLPFPVQVALVRQGDAIPMEIERCNSDKTDHSYAVARAMREVNTNKVIPLESFYSMVPAGCHSALFSSIHRVPIDAEPGRYEFFGGSITHGLVRTFDVTFRSTEFDVLPSLPKPSMQGAAGRPPPARLVPARP